MIRAGLTIEQAALVVSGLDFLSLSLSEIATALQQGGIKNVYMSYADLVNGLSDAQSIYSRIYPDAVASYTSFIDAARGMGNNNTQAPLKILNVCFPAPVGLDDFVARSEFTLQSLARWFYEDGDFDGAKALIPDFVCNTIRQKEALDFQLALKPYEELKHWFSVPNLTIEDWSFLSIGAAPREHNSKNIMKLGSTDSEKFKAFHTELIIAVGCGVLEGVVSYRNEGSGLYTSYIYDGNAEYKKSINSRRTSISKKALSGWLKLKEHYHELYLMLSPEIDVIDLRTSRKPKSIETHPASREKEGIQERREETLHKLIKELRLAAASLTIELNVRELPFSTNQIFQWLRERDKENFVSVDNTLKKPFWRDQNICNCSLAVGSKGNRSIEKLFVDHLSN